MQSDKVAAISLQSLNNNDNNKYQDGERVAVKSQATLAEKCMIIAFSQKPVLVNIKSLFGLIFVLCFVSSVFLAFFPGLKLHYKPTCVIFYTFTIVRFRENLPNWLQSLLNI